MWQPSCTHGVIKARSELYAQVRAFFMSRDVLEVETPVLSRAGASDPWLASIKTDPPMAGYLQTSPEFPMKRLLASGIGPIFQICKCFRSGEVGSRHNPEFTMLEWYRPGFSLDDLIEEIATLAGKLLNVSAWSSVTYRQIFQDVLGIHPFEIRSKELVELVRHHTSYRGEPMDRTSNLDLLLTTCIEPTLGQEGLCFVTDYPAEQASLAKKAQDDEGYMVAKRAELYYQGIELANAYDELVDPVEQRARFLEDNASRAAMGLPEIVLDEHLLSAMQHGMPDCAGVALGLDRLLMLSLGARELSDVLSFPADRA